MQSEKPKTFRVDLTAPEIVLLDGLCRPEIQAVVATAKDAMSLASATGLSDAESAMVATILAVAAEKGRLTFSRVNIARCPCCGRSDGYWPVKRTTRYKRRGEPDYDRPKLFSGYDLDRGFVVMERTIFVGFCEACRPRVEPVLRERLETMRVALPDYWEGVQHRYARFDNRRCTKCGWTGHEGQMRRLRTLFGDGYYYGGCPKCPAENHLGGTVIDRADGFAVVERQAE